MVATLSIANFGVVRLLSTFIPSLHRAAKPEAQAPDEFGQGL